MTMPGALNESEKDSKSKKQIFYDHINRGFNFPRIVTVSGRGTGLSPKRLGRSCFGVGGGQGRTEVGWIESKCLLGRFSQITLSGGRLYRLVETIN